MHVDAEDPQRRVSARGDGRAADAGAAAKVDNGAWGEGDAECRYDVIDEQEVQRPVIEGKRRALAGPVERLVGSQRGVTPFDVRRRQRAQRASHLAETKVGEVPLFERVRKSTNCHELKVWGE